MQRVTTIGGLGAVTDTSTLVLPSTDTSGGGLLALAELPTLLVWIAGAVALGYAATKLFSAPRVRRRDPSTRRRRR